MTGLSPSEALPEESQALPPEALPNVDELVTEDDAPVDNIFSEKQQRLLTEALYSSWKEQPFVAFSNVGLFFAVHEPPLVPDVLLSLEVKVPKEIGVKSNRSYMIWEYGKPPEVVVEIVSNKKGHEADSKLQAYARIGVKYSVLFDPEEVLSSQILRLYELHGTAYVELARPWLPGVGLGLCLWEGHYEDLSAVWLRWCTQDEQLIPTGAERADQQRQRAEQAERQAEQERQRAERLAERLRALGIDESDSV